MSDLPCPVGWSMAKLGDLGEVNRGRSRHRPRYAEHLYGGPYPFIQTGDIRTSGGRISSHTQTYSEAGLAQSRLWPAGTMCITIAANIAETAILTYPACFPDSVVGFIADEDKADVYFIEYMFRRLRSSLQHQATGSVQDNINLATLDRLRFPLPSPDEQRAIAGVLRALDDKVEQIRQTARALERLARAMFRAWFVDYEPIKAKAAGAAAFPSMPQPVFDALPTRFVESEIGPVPEGWEAGTLGSILKESTDKNREEQVQLVLSAVSSGDLVPSDDHFTKRVYSKSTNNYKVVPPGAVAFNPSRINIGSIGVNHRDVSGVVSPVYVVCVARREFEWFLEFYLHLPQIRNQYETLASGSVRQSLRAVDFLSIALAIPTSEMVSAFNHEFLTLKRLSNALMSESAKLAEMRDYLLPKLMSGDFRVEAANG